MKRKLIALMLGLCLLPALAAAEICVDGVAVEPNFSGYVVINTDGATVTGSLFGGSLQIADNVTELTLSGVTVAAQKGYAVLVSSSGEVTLNFEGSNTLIGGKQSDGINTSANLTINLVDGAEPAEVTVQGGHDADGSIGGYGIRAKSLTIEGKGSLHALGGSSTQLNEAGPNYAGDGIYSERAMTIGSDVTVTAAGGSSAAWGGHGIEAANLTVNGTLTAAGGDGEIGGGEGVYAADLTVNGTLAAKGGASDEGNRAGHGVWAVNSLTVSGMLTAEGGKGVAVGGKGILVEAGGCIIKDGAVVSAAGGAGFSGGSGVAAADLTVNGTLTAVGGAGEMVSGDGVYARNSLAVSGTLTAVSETLTAEGGKGEAFRRYGINAPVIYISGDVMAAAASDWQTAIDSSASLTLDGVFGGESEDGEEWWDMQVSTMRYFRTFSERQKIRVLPQTGDPGSLLGWAALLAASGLAGVKLRGRNKR